MFFEFSLAFGTGKKKDHEPADEEFRDASGGQHEIAHSQIGFAPSPQEGE